MFRKTPLAWLQVTREKTRLAVAIAGIAFADILIFVQLGFRDALFDSAVKPHQSLHTDLVLINPQFETFAAVKSFKRDRLYQTQGFEGVESVTSLHIDIGQWRNPTNRTTRAILIFGIDPGSITFNLPDVNQNLHQIQMFNHALFDQSSRPEYGDIAQIIQKESTLETELNKRNIKVSGVFTLGTSFTADGNVIVSDSTFMNLFSEQKPDEIDVGLINLKPGADIKKVQSMLKAALPDDVKVLTLAEFADIEKAYWANATPIGFIFGFGTVIGFIVGLIIVYQILYSDVSDHLAEYATLKAMGYSDGYLVGVLVQEALLLAVLGFMPGIVFANGMYSLAQSATLLPIVMTTDRAVFVLGLTIVMCTGSGAIALRKLQSADPADIF
ncbi:MAG: ABC transporter permease DevC [Tychonema bourrellyi B0820]|uniref:ABC transporter n=1 Tax=Tychonema bourrellyi FEM_GT703 TaxID=2040638 RepID=A0A2G4F4B4_9CYAN|nr:ABC transporter permease DevC [Tychonema bourrellyi]MDQ2098209.1 ABC transporter permease DevC [Tychonema bourrellyi B0820]PHX56623.1 ABC transporter [Tychonema bourrellyi FEM_GT703]